MAHSKHIRQARLDDVARIYEAIRDNPDEVLPRSAPDILSHFDRFYVYDDGELRGVISWQVLPDLDLDQPDRTVEIISFSVRKADQGRGIGAALLRRMIEILNGFNLDRVIVLTFYPGFFAKFGFHKTSKKTLYHKIYLGCIHCVKHQSPLTCPEVAMELKMGQGRERTKHKDTKTRRKK